MMLKPIQALRCCALVFENNQRAKTCTVQIRYMASVQAPEVLVLDRWKNRGAKPLLDGMLRMPLANGLTKLCLGIDASPTLYMFFFVAAHRLAIRISKYSSSETQT